MRKNRVSGIIFITGCIMPVLILFLLAYGGMGILESVFSIIPLFPGGTINTTFLPESIFLNSSAMYLGLVSGVATSISLMPHIEMRKYDSTNIAYFIAYPVVFIGLFLIFAIIKTPNDLSRANPPFRGMSYWYFTTCLYYSMSVVFSYICGLVSILFPIVLPIKYLIRK